MQSTRTTRPNWKHKQVDDVEVANVNDDKKPMPILDPDSIRKRMKERISERAKTMSEPDEFDMDKEMNNDVEQIKGSVELKKPTMLTRKTWNPAVISPVFFGYTLAKAAQEDERELRRRKQSRIEEVWGLCLHVSYLFCLHI